MFSIRNPKTKEVLGRANTYYDAVNFINEECTYSPSNYEIYDEASQEIVTEAPHWRYDNQENLMEMCAFDMGVSTENGQTTIVTVGYGCASYLTVDNERAIELAKFILETVGKESD